VRVPVMRARIVRRAALQAQGQLPHASESSALLRRPPHGAFGLNAMADDASEVVDCHHCCRCGGPPILSRGEARA